jgi:hypothetical protein
MKRIHEELKQAALRGIRLAAREAQGVVVKEIRRVKPHAPVDTGEMGRVTSWPVTHIPEGAVLESATKQAVFQEFGTKPFTPPIEPLRAWAKRKLRGRKFKRKKTSKVQKFANAAKKHAHRASEAAAGRLPGGGAPPLGRNAARTEGAASGASVGTSVRKSKKRDPDVEALARAAQWSIKLKGIKAKRFFREAEKKFPKIVDKRVLAALRKVKV